LGTEVSPGKYEDSDIPGAKDPNEAYDTRVFPKSKWECTPLGTPAITGPHGIVTKFVADWNTAEERVEYGAPIVNVDGATVCVITPRTKVVKVTGTKTYFQWSNLSCPLDNITLLDFVKDEQETVEERDQMEPLIRCKTDWPKWLIDQFLKLIQSGVSPERALLLLGQLSPSREGAPRLRLPRQAQNAFTAPEPRAREGQAFFAAERAELPANPGGRKARKTNRKRP
jgi:hypothetical protein